MRFFISIIILCLSVGADMHLHAQTSGTIEGIVLDRNDGKPLPGVNVRLLETTKGTSTDSEGFFRIHEVQPGQQTVRFTYVGYQSRVIDVEVNRGETVSLEVNLNVRQMMLDGIRVTALRPDEIAESSLDERDVMEANPRDSGELLRSVKGVDAVRRGPVGLDPVVRGLRETEVGTYLDGTRIFPAGPARMDSPLSHLDPSAIESIEVVKGPYALTWGGGNMSAVRVETQSLQSINEPFGGVISSGYDTNLNAFEESATFKGRYGKVQYWVHGAWREGDDYESGDETVVPANFLSREIRGKLGYAITSESNLKLSVGYQRQDDIDYPGRLLNAEYFDAYNYSASWNWTPALGSISSMEVSAYINNVDHGMDNRGKPTAEANPNRMPPFALDVGVKSRAHVTGGKINAVLNLSESSDLEVGSDIYSVNRNAIRTIDRRDEGIKPPAFPLVDKMWPDANIRKGGFYGKLEKNFSTNWKMASTLRLDAVSADAGELSDFFSENASNDLDHSELNLNGSMTLTYIPVRNWSVGFGIGSVARTADATERYSDRIPASKAQTSAEFVGNPLLEPERSTQADLWIDAGFPVWNFSLNLFAREMRNYITLEPTDLPKRLPLSPDTVYRYINGDATFWGFDVSGGYRVIDSVVLSAGLNYLWGKDTELNEPALGVTPLTLYGSIRYESNGLPWFAEAKVRWAGEQDRVAVSRGETATESYWLADVRTGFTLWKQLSVQAGIENILDTNYANHLNAKNPFTGQQILEPGRLLHLDVSYRF